MTNIYYFNEFRLDAEKRCLWHADELVTLTPKALDTLLVLVRNSGEIVDKNVLLDEVWSDTFVEESTLAQNILTLRKTLSTYESGEKFITTVPRRGYRFVAPVSLRPKGNTNGNAFSPAAFAAEGERSANGHTDHILADAKRANDRIGGPYVVATAIVGLLVASAFLTWYLSLPPSMIETRFGQFRLSAVLSDANIRAATISPDGRYIGLIEKRGDAERIMLRQVNEPNTIELALAGSGQIMGAAFAPNSDYVYYSRYRDDEIGGRIGELFRVPALGGPPQMILRDIDSRVSVDRSGRLAFVRRRVLEGDTAVIVSESDGSNERVVAVRNRDEAFQNASIAPDGRSVVCVVNSKGDLGRPMDIIVVDTTSGEQRPLTSHRWLWVGQLAWLADGSGLAVVGYGSTSPDLTDEIWLVSYPQGNARQLESGINGVFGVSVTEDGKSMVAVKSNKITSFVVSPVSDLSTASTIVTKAGDQSLLPLGADWSTNDLIVYSTTDGGNADIWSVRSDGTERRQLTSDKFADLAPRVSADSRYIYYLSNRSGTMSVWRMNADGSEARKITEGADVFSVNVAPDGKFIYYTSRADSVFSQHLWRATAEGHDAVRLTQQTTLTPRISPDGKTIACYFPASNGGKPVLTLLNGDSGAVIRQFPPIQGSFLIEWQQDSQALWLTSRDVSGTTLWKQPIDGSVPLKIRHWPNEMLFRLAFSPNGDRLFYEKGVSTNDVVLLTDSNASL